MFVLRRFPAVSSLLKSFIPRGHLQISFPVGSTRFNHLGLPHKSIFDELGDFHFHALAGRNKAVQSIIRRRLTWRPSKRGLYLQSRAGGEDMNSMGGDQSQAPLVSARIQCSGSIADQLMEALLCFGANSVSIEDANSGESLGQAFSDGPLPWEPTKREFWNQSCITALFSAGQDVGECLAFAANSIGLKEIPKYEITECECHDWAQKVQQILYRQSASLSLAFHTINVSSFETTSWENFWHSQRATIPLVKKQAALFLREKLKTARLALTDVTEAELLTEEATNGDPWGPETRTMAAISQKAFEVDDYWRIVEILHKRLLVADKKQWRQSFKTLVLLEYLLTHGPESVAAEFRSDKDAILQLSHLQCVDDRG